MMIIYWVTLGASFLLSAIALIGWYVQGKLCRRAVEGWRDALDREQNMVEYHEETMQIVNDIFVEEGVSPWR
jgi:hypothetical protein